MAHRLPFQRSENAAKPESPPFPTATHAVADAHDTPVSEADPASDGTGVGSMDQAVPSQCSASGTGIVPRPSSVGTSECPTAVHSVADRHDTAVRVLDSVPPGFGVGRTDQAAPFQDSTSGAPPLPPTAVHASADVHDTADTPLPPVRCWITHRTPFHRSTSVPSTAVHARADVQDTCDSKPCRNVAFGLATTDQAGAAAPARPATAPAPAGAASRLAASSPAPPTASKRAHSRSDSRAWAPREKIFASVTGMIMAPASVTGGSGQHATLGAVEANGEAALGRPGPRAR
jgi:hypothetical protein